MTGNRSLKSKYERKVLPQEENLKKKNKAADCT